MSDTIELDPLQVVRYSNGEKVFGLKPSALKAKIDAGEIPAPIPMSDSGRALGWTGQMVMDHHKRMAALAAMRAKAAAEKPAAKKLRRSPPRRRRAAELTASKNEDARR